MNRRLFLTAAGVTGVAFIATPARANFLEEALGWLRREAPGIAGPSVTEVAAGLKEALRVGSGRVVDRLGRAGGFLHDPAIHIPLPEPLPRVQEALALVRMSGLADDLEARLNGAAETATSLAEPHFWGAIDTMTIDDALGILNGPLDSATRYFQGRMTPGLLRDMRPVVDGALAEAGAVQAYDRMMSNYRKIPFVPDLKAELRDHALQGTMAGIFHHVAKEEAAIRTDPAARTTDLLRRVFG